MLLGWSASVVVCPFGRCDCDIQSEHVKFPVTTSDTGAVHFKASKNSDLDRVLDLLPPTTRRGWLEGALTAWQVWPRKLNDIPYFAHNHNH